ncbi:archaemetzincin family Zn-dependent metalloprotease [bacterium]|nr:archaemetzincin family Zn-dependent metalloprotease [bacterium]
MITPIGNCSDRQLMAVAEAVGVQFGVHTQTKKTLADVEFALDSERNQYHSTRILEALQAYAPEQAGKIVALVQVDLFIPILTHVYGEAQLDGRACMVSSHRLKEDLKTLDLEEELTRRVIKEVYHELGHTFGLLHCKDASCIMHYCRSIRDVDRKSESFCRYCKVLLQDAFKRISRK